MLKDSNLERDEFQNQDMFEEEICKYNALVEVLAHPNLELGTIILELSLEKMTSMAKILDAYEQVLPLLQSLIIRSPSFVGNQIFPLFHQNKTATQLMKELILIHQGDLHTLLFKSFVSAIVSSPEQYDPSDISTLSNLTLLVKTTCESWNSIVNQIPRFFIYVSHVLNEHFKNIRSLSSVFHFYVLLPALNDPVLYNLCDRSSVTPNLTKVLQYACKLWEFVIYGQKFTTEDFSSELNTQVELSNPIVLNFYNSVLKEEKTFEKLCDFDSVYNNELPQIETFLCDNYHQISLLLIERMAKDKLISLSDALASLKRKEDEPKDTKKNTSSRPNDLIVITNLKNCGDVVKILFYYFFILFINNKIIIYFIIYYFINFINFINFFLLFSNLFYFF